MWRASDEQRNSGMRKTKSVRSAGKKGKKRLHGAITLVDSKVLYNLRDYGGHNPSKAANTRKKKVHNNYSR